jgi:hypothetical protein
LQQHVSALLLDLILQQLWVAVRAYRHRGSAWKQVNVVISPPRRWQTLRLGEDGRELGDEELHQVAIVDGADVGAAWSIDAAPRHTVIAPPERHRV